MLLLVIMRMMMMTTMTKMLCVDRCALILYMQMTGSVLVQFVILERNVVRR